MTLQDPWGPATEQDPQCRRRGRRGPEEPRPWGASPAGAPLCHPPAVRSRTIFGTRHASLSSSVQWRGETTLCQVPLALQAVCLSCFLSVSWWTVLRGPQAPVPCARRRCLCTRPGELPVPPWRTQSRQEAGQLPSWWGVDAPGRPQAGSPHRLFTGPRFPASRWGDLGQGSGLGPQFLLPEWRR